MRTQAVLDVRQDRKPSYFGPEATQIWSTFTHLITEVSECRIFQAESGAVLAESNQLFEPIVPPITSFNGLRRKSISQIKSDLLGLPKVLLAMKTSHGLSALIRLALPVVIAEETSHLALSSQARLDVACQPYRNVQRPNT